MTGLLAGAASADEPPKSWTDPRVIDALIRSCSADVASLVPQEGPGDPNPLSCAPAEDQSCESDPCFDEQESKCKPRCTKACERCSKPCVARCESCKKGCSDDACRKGCAVQCAGCREACTKASDRCGTGGCAAGYKQCRARMKAAWKKNGCPAACKTYVACEDQCYKKNKDAEDRACIEACLAPMPKSCSVTFCPGGRTTMGSME